MRLIELTGYKSHPLNKAAQQLKPASPEQKASDYPQSYDIKTMQDFIKKMAEEDWHRIGAGQFANIFQHPNYPYVLKVFVNDPRYLDFFQVIKQNQSNPHVPKVRGKFMKVGNEGYVVRMEPLAALTGVGDPILRQYIDPDLAPIFGNLLDQDNIRFLDNKQPDFWDIMQEIFNISTELDWHTGNVMKRGNTLVVTDPFASD